MKKEFNPDGMPPHDRQSQLDSDDTLTSALDALLEGASLDSGPADTPDAPELCPDPGEWLTLACGDLRPADVDFLLAHAARCRECAARLRVSLRLLSEEASPEEASEIAQLASASPAWRHRLSVELAHTPHKSAKKNATRFYLWAGAGLAASLTLAVSLSMWQHHVNTPERLLAEAYTHSRTFDLRMPGAGFAEVMPGTHLRGGSTGRESSRLLDARSRIEQQLEKTPNDAHWLQLEARADIQEEKFDPAIDILDRLLAAGPVSSSLLLDDASAYFQRGTFSGSEDDRATALDTLRRADELTPSDSVVLFNEAVAMEDRGQVMNAVETWNRYLRFEHDPLWLAEGRRRLQALELKLNQIKTHQSRMENHLATPKAMLALAADPATLDVLDEELSSSLLPKLLASAYPQPVDRSRGSPCDESCQASRGLLRAVAASLVRNHQDSWINQLLPPDFSPDNQDFTQAARLLGQAIDANASGDAPSGAKLALQSRQAFRLIGNVAGEDRAEVERVYALQRTANLSGCYQAANALLSRDPQFVWIMIHGLNEEALCDTGTGSATKESPLSLRAEQFARDHHYALLTMRARNIRGGAAVESGDAEGAWRIFLATERMFFAGDYPAFRLYTTLSGLAEVEKSTPRVHLSLLLQREVIGILELTQGRKLIPSQRFDLAIAAIRAGYIPEAQSELRKVQTELAEDEGGKAIQGFLADSEIAMANLYLGHRDLRAAAEMLDTAKLHMEGELHTSDQRAYAAARGELELAMGHPENAEPMVRGAILEEERKARRVGSGNIPFARQDRDLYAVLAGLWLAQGRSGEEILALWERYRLRILGEPVSICRKGGLACLKPRLHLELARLEADHTFGQVVLLDRVLTYQASAQRVVWSTIPLGEQELLEMVAPLERAVSSPATSQNSVDQAARRIGDLLLVDLPKTSSAPGEVLLESDPLLGNLPWPAVETGSGPLGLRFNVEESPSLLLRSRSNTLLPSGGHAPLVVGTSFASDEGGVLPEVLKEARDVARFGKDSNLLLSDKATQAQVRARLETASAIHFAGHSLLQDGATRLLLAPAASSAHPGGDAYLDSALLRKYPPRAARLIVFSSCSTGKREEGWNHGMEDIVDTLASLRVPEVVATRWQIDSASAVPMMELFYSGLAKGMSVPAALTGARQSMAQSVRYRHPYYWAAYYSSGSGKSDLSQIFHPIS